MMRILRKSNMLSTTLVVSDAKALDLERCLHLGRGDNTTRNHSNHLRHPGAPHWHAMLCALASYL